MPWQGVAHNIAVANIRTAYPGQGLKAASSLWGAGQMMFNKFLLVVSTPDDVRQAGVLASLLRRARLPEQALLSRGPLDVLDHAAPQAGLGGKMGRRPDRSLAGGCPCRDSAARPLGVLLRRDVGRLLAGRNLGSSGAFRRPFGRSRCRRVRPAERSAGGELGRRYGRRRRGVSVFRPAVAGRGGLRPSRRRAAERRYGFFRREDQGRRSRGIRRRWPNVVASSPETIARVDDRWAEYGLGEFVESPSLRYLKLQERPGAEF